MFVDDSEGYLETEKGREDESILRDAEDADRINATTKTEEMLRARL